MHILASAEMFETYDFNEFVQTERGSTLPSAWLERMKFPLHFTVTWQGGVQENFNQLTLPGTHSNCIKEELGHRNMVREGWKTARKFTSIYTDIREKQ